MSNTLPLNNGTNSRNHPFGCTHEPDGLPWSMADEFGRGVRACSRRIGSRCAACAEGAPAGFAGSPIGDGSLSSGGRSRVICRRTWAHPTPERKVTTSDGSRAGEIKGKSSERNSRVAEYSTAADYRKGDNSVACPGIRIESRQSMATGLRDRGCQASYSEADFQRQLFGALLQGGRLSSALPSASADVEFIPAPQPKGP